MSFILSEENEKLRHALEELSQEKQELEAQKKELQQQIEELRERARLDSVATHGEDNSNQGEILTFKCILFNLLFLPPNFIEI